MQKIKLRGVRVNNLQSINLDLPLFSFIVFTGVSGSGKSSLAFETLYMEGQRRYLQSLSHKPEFYMEEFPRPDADVIEGLTPTVAISQKKGAAASRSTLGTITSIYDYLRVLFSHLATLYSPITGQPLSLQSISTIIEKIAMLFEGQTITLLAPLQEGQLSYFYKIGYVQARIDGTISSLDEKSTFQGKKIELVIDRISLSDKERARLVEGITKALEIGQNSLICLSPDGKEHFFSLVAVCSATSTYYQVPSAEDYSFNHPSGMCPECKGLGTSFSFDLDRLITSNLSIENNCIAIAPDAKTKKWKIIYRALADRYDFSLAKPWKSLSDEAKKIFLYGPAKLKIKQGSMWTIVHWNGVIGEAKSRFSSHQNQKSVEKFEGAIRQITCPECLGAKITPLARAAKWMGKGIFELCQMPVSELLEWLKTLNLQKKQSLVGAPLLEEIQKRLGFLVEVGLGYLSLDRQAASLSGGELQRARLTCQLGSGLIGVTYILDEPSIGLHAIDNKKLINILYKLRDKGNHIIVVEHDAETICAADYIVDVGPLGGQKGGKIVASGTLQTLLSCKESLTADYLTGKRSIGEPKVYRPHTQGYLTLKNAHCHHLKNVDLHLPINTMTAIVGVSGSGKSSLIVDTLYPALEKGLIENNPFEKVFLMDQSPIGRTPRSNSATYTKVFDAIRDLFAELPQSKLLGLTASHFSFNVKTGSCQRCQGMGLIPVDVDFLEQEWVACPSCRGHRFDERTLSAHYKGKSIYDILEMTIEEAFSFFEAIPKIAKTFELLCLVGLGYLKVGQPATDLSGGEAQRIKLAKELIRPSEGKALYILDEPTTGLHFYDVHKLKDLLSRLVDKGNTVVMIEHNLDMVAACDFVIELGPEGGKKGGYIIAQTTPRDLATLSTPTGKAMQEHFKQKELIKPATTPLPLKEDLFIFNAHQNYLKNLTLSLPHGKCIFFTGPSGSGKSSLAFETIFAEGQRRYIESMPAFARKWFPQMEKARVDLIEGLCPSIAIEQSTHSQSRKNSVGTLSGIHDYLRIILAGLGVPHCPVTNEPITHITQEQIIDRIASLPEGEKIALYAPILQKSEKNSEKLLEKGFLRAKIGDKLYALDEDIPPLSVHQPWFVLLDRFTMNSTVRPRILEALRLAFSICDSYIMIEKGDKTEKIHLGFVSSLGLSYPPLHTASFSFYHTDGACPRCEGIGELDGFTFEEMIDKGMTGYKLISLICPQLKSKVVELFPHCKTPLFLWENEERNHFIYGNPLQNWRGVAPVLTLLSHYGKDSRWKELSDYSSSFTCPECKGYRLNPLALSTKLGSLCVKEILDLPLNLLINFIEKLPIPKIFQESFLQIKQRLTFALSLGLSHLTLNRSVPTLSKGELMRLYIAKQMGSGLSGALYILDEPSIGLHPKDLELLKTSLKKLQQLSNTLLIVEHEPLLLDLAEHIVEFGPGSGKSGGQIIAQGTLAEIKKNKKSLTGSILRKELAPSFCQALRKPVRFLELAHANKNNLKDLSLNIPLGTFCCIIGPSGSGKSSLVNGLLKPALEMTLSKRRAEPTFLYKDGATLKNIPTDHKLSIFDTRQMRDNKRADLLTYTDMAPLLRAFFAELPEARIRGLKGAHFSTNHLFGMCRSCWGLGYKKIKLELLPPTEMQCPDCKGYRLAPLSLLVTYKGYHFGQLLQMTVDQAALLLPPMRKLTALFEAIQSVNLGYLTLGRQLLTLSLGELQRLLFAREIAKRSRNKMIYLLDEPSIGLHPKEVEELAAVIKKTVQEGHSVIAIDHDLHLIAKADHLIEFGKNDFEEKILFEGTPQELLESKKSVTAPYLIKSLKEKRK